MTTEITNKLNISIDNSISALKSDLSKINTGRSQSEIFDLLKVNYHGTLTSLAHVSIISTLDFNRVTIEPYEKDLIKPIEKLLRDSNLNINWQIDGSLIKVTFAQATIDKREEMVTMVKKYGEKAKVSIRDHRRVALQAVGSSDLSKNEASSVSKKIESIISKSVTQIDEIVNNKSKLLKS